ncbi:MAG: hypothetical protein Q9181_007290 [Wetmoreana brouardii]
MRQVTAQLLSALDFLHRTGGIIHTDIKPSNILFDLSSSGRDDEREQHIQLYLRLVPMPTGIAYPTFDYVETKTLYAPISDASMVNIQLADLGSACWKGKHLQEWIQPELLRAPEVIFELPWSTAVDIWNLGVVIFELMTARTLFRGETVKDHLAQMAAFVGPFPQEFMSKALNRELYLDADGTSTTLDLTLTTGASA